MSKFTLVHRVMLQESHANFNSARAVRRKFPRVRVPHRKTAQNLVNKVTKMGVSTDREPKRQRRVLWKKTWSKQLCLNIHPLSPPCKRSGVSKDTVKNARKLLDPQS
jgi:hypothetical protein